jgi:hypothetical protein
MFTHPACPTCNLTHAIKQSECRCPPRTPARQNAALDRGAVRDSLVRVDALVGLLAVEEALDELLDLGDTRRAADQDNLVNVALLQVRVLKDLLDRLKRGLRGAQPRVVGLANQRRGKKREQTREQLAATI